MVNLGSTIILMIVVVIIGKRERKLEPSSYLVVIFIALIQVAILLYRMYTMPDMVTP